MQTSFAGGAAGYRRWLNAITEFQERRVRLEVMDTDRRLVGELTWMFVSGSVTIDVTAETSRTLDLELTDPSQSLRFEPDNDEMPVYLSRVIQAYDERFVPPVDGQGGGWVSCPVFCGPVVDFDRDGPLVTLRCDSMERLALGDLGHGRTWPRKTPVTDVIRALLRETGEDRLGGIPDLPQRLGEKLTLKRTDKPWREAEKLARDLNRVLVSDPDGGIPRLRRTPSKPTLTLNDRTVASALRVDRDAEGIKNWWIVQGPKPRGKKDRITASVRLPRGHKSSAWSLGRNQQPRWLIDESESSHIKKQKDAVERVERKRAEATAEQRSYAIDTLPFPHLEEFDMIQVVGQAGSARLRIRQATLPLTGEAMSLGAIRRVGIARRSKGRRGARLVNR